MQLTDEELDNLMSFYTGLIPQERRRLAPVIKDLGVRGLLYIYDRSSQTLDRSTPRYYITLSERGRKIMFSQDPLQLVLSCVRCRMTSEALEFIKRVPNGALPEILVCSDATVRNNAKRRLQCTGGNGIYAP